MPIDWKDAAVKDRLLASIIASFDGKINCARVAQLFGEGATYNAIENFLRGPKREAMKLKAEAGDGPLPKGPPRTPRKPKTNGVKTGRVTKSKKGGSSTSASPIKKEHFFDEGSFMQSGGEGDVEGDMDDAENDDEFA
ncbi:hypothetical protein K504DRAFT_22769 [Pleomassaria siparia CBS 279.74]|uniref:Uncharacterized protein n=1 Tax=Pleomassaria siparia CBS 279.74 TaxID=1314801 RepID=A0A6G1KRQ7_9PLEO|nr:hypothetical protein K504DRAFT_22769 [Pleomassaria siparia CBS 279.74]